MQGVKLWDARAKPVRVVGTVEIKDGQLVVDGPLWFQSMIADPIPIRGQLVVPEATQQFLNALIERYSGTGFRAEWL